jgi:DNA-binding MarR family transcriptional regulator
MQRSARNLILELLKLSSMTISRLRFFTGYDRCHMHRELKKLLDAGEIETRRMDANTRVYVRKGSNPPTEKPATQQQLL